MSERQFGHQSEFWKAQPKRRTGQPGPFKKGHHFGRLRKYEDPQQLLEDCLEYLQWCNDNPLIEVKAMAVGGEVKKIEIPKLRAATLNGLHLFLGIDRNTWGRMGGRYEDRDLYAPELKEVVDYIEQAIFEQKFAAAAADLLNPVFIGKAIGLIERRELSGPGGGPMKVITSDMSNEEAAEIWLEAIREEPPMLEDQRKDET